MKIRKFIISLILVSFFLSDLPSELLFKLEIPQTIDAVVEPNYSEPVKAEPSDRLSFYDGEHLSVNIEDGKTLRISGVSVSEQRRYLIIQLKAEDSDENEIMRDNVKLKDSTFSHKLRIPSSDAETVQLVVYSNNEYYGDYISWVMQYIYLKQNDGVWSIAKSPALNNNMEKFEAAKSLTRALNPTRNVQSRDDYIITLAEKITSGDLNDYEKALKIHDFICENFAYDMAIRGTQENYDAKGALFENRAICSGFANSYAALCRAAGLPCLVVSGISVGDSDEPYPFWNSELIESDSPNHAWNEVYVDGRWIIVDTTWDCGNIWRDGKSVAERELSHIYFDANIEFFSMNHKIIKYKDI